MKKGILFLILSVLTLGAWADTYTPLEWIDYTGDDFEHTRACYYETGYTPNFNTRVEFLCQGYTDDTKWRAICYGRTSHTDGFSIYRCDYGNQFGYFVGGSVNNHVGSYVKNTNYRIVADVKSMLVNGINVKSTDRTEDNYVGPGEETMTLFSGHRDWPFKGRIYYFNIYEGNELKHAFVPVLKNGTTPCFKCTVCNDYKEPHGSGFGYNQLTYTPVEYIEYTSGGNDNQVSRTFDTGYVPNEKTKVEVKFRPTGQNNWGAIFSGRNKEPETGISLYHNNTEKWLGYFVGKYKKDEYAEIATNWTTDYTAVCSLNGIKLNGTDQSATNAQWASTTRAITIFSNPEKDQIFLGRIYYFKIYEDEDLKHNFIPVKASDNSVGFYDTVDKKYITTRTTTDSQYFTASSSWNGTDDAILPSFKYGGSYSAYTWTKVSTEDYGNGEANNSHFNTIVEIPGDDSNGKKWFDVDYLMPITSSIEWQLGNSVLPSNWATGNKYGDVYVRRNFIIASGTSLPGTIYMPTPHDDAPCEYYINGTPVWSRTGTEPSVKGWYEDEVVRLTDAQKALIKTDGTVNVFAFHVHQNWGGRYADGGLYGAAGTDGTPSKKFTDNDNRRYLEETIALAESEGVDASIIDYGKEKQNFLQDASVALEKLRIARKRHYAERRSEAFVGSAPEAGKDYYLYNVGQRQFLGGGNDWGTTLSLVYASNAMTLEADGNKFKINSHRVIYGRNVGYVSSNGYIDSEQPASFTFSETSSGSKTYTISYESGKYLGYKASTYNRVVVDNTDASSTDNHWKLISKAEFDELQNKATVSAPVDATYLISNPGYERGMARGDWTYVGCSTEGLNDNYQNDTNYPDYVVTGNDGGEISVSRTLTGLKPGIYKVSVQACYRDGWNAACAWNHYNGTQHRNAKLIAGNKVADIKTLAECGGKVPGITTNLDNASLEAIIGGFPDTGPEAAEFFEVGQFWTSVDNVLVGSDGQLTIAVKRESGDHIDGDWVAVDNWRLTYLGPTSESVSVTNAGYATYCSNRALDFTNTDIKAYVGTKNGDKLTFTPINQVPANTGLLLAYEGGKTEDVPVIASASAIAENCLVGVNEETTIDGNDYILNKINDGVGFYKAGSWTTLGAHKAYIPAAVGNGVKGFTIDFDDDATGISLMEDGRSQMEDGAIYNVAGQRLSKTQKGINIVNGKKILK